MTDILMIAGMILLNGGLKVDINKKDLARMARLMYDLQQFCIERSSCSDDEDRECPLRLKNCDFDIKRFPEFWDINIDDVERLEKEADD